MKENWNALFAASIVCLILSVGCASPTGGQRIDNIPMYGQPEITRPDFLKKADEDFIAKASGGFGGDRKVASDAWIVQADKYMREENLDYAMRRYNQAWLLNPDSYKPYWGFARVAVERSRYDEAFRHFEKAMQLINDKYEEAALVSDMGIAYYNKGNMTKDSPQQQDRYFALANEKFKESTDIDPTYANAWEKWAYLLFRQGKYSEAWEKAKKAKALGPNTISERFLIELGEKMPEPK